MEKKENVTASGLKVKEKIVMSSIRKLIAERLTYSLRTAAHCTLMTEADASELVRFREMLLSEMEKKHGLRPTYTDILVKVVARALEDYPIFNSTLEGEEIKIFEDINIGVAVATERGLIVPVVRNANKKSLEEVSLSLRELIKKAREGKLSLNDVVGGTFSISNLGTYGIDVFTPIIKPPEVAILGVGRILEKPVVIAGTVTVRPIIHLSLTFDHRVADGDYAAKFLQRIVEILQNPSQYLL
jgi:pyruvate dehydrogenase E2 component (dihydrolipoamide acetyltransferase)